MNKLAKIFIESFVILLIVSPFSTVYARSSSEIEEEIEQQQAALENTANNLNNAKSILAESEILLSQSQEGLPKIEAEIAKLESEIAVNTESLKLIEDKKKLLSLQRERKKALKQKAVTTSYIDWRTESQTANLLTDEENEFYKNQKYGSILVGIEADNISILSEDLGDIEEEINGYSELLASLEKSNKELQDKKNELLSQISYYANSIASNSELIVTLENNISQISSQIDFLSAAQFDAIKREQEILGGGNAGATNSAGCDLASPSAGKIYFCGNGRDLPMGHGVGMSQYGAKGAADLGYSAEQILTTYYTGVTVANYPMSSEISVKYCPGDPALDAFQDGCSGGASPVTERVSFDQYLSGLGEMPTSWPMEARKAQIIAARTYAVRYTNNGDPNYPICLTTYCQVSYFKNGYQGESAVVSATKDIVITYNGALIEALYSADNNQGSGTADVGTRFQNIYGDASTGHPYLQSVNDNTFAANSRLYWNYYCGSTACGLWPWKSREYSYSDIDAMMVHTGTYYAGEVMGMKNTLGNVTGMAFERDASGRVKRVIIQGSSGNIVYMGGWWFKYLWNVWQEDIGWYDFMYSQTYYMF